MDEFRFKQEDIERKRERNLGACIAIMQTVQGTKVSLNSYQIAIL